MPVTIPTGRRRPPVVPAARTTGSTGSTQGETAVAAPASNAKSASSTMRDQVFYAQRRVTYQSVWLALRRVLARARRLVGALEETQERLDDQRVELRARSVLELGPSTLVADAHAVRAIRDHRLIRVGHGEDARLGRDLTARQPGRVARAVRPLVVRKHPARDVLQPRAAQQTRAE